MNATRCKLRLKSIAESWGSAGAREVTMVPVTSGSEENKRFFASSPSGEFKLTVSGEAAKAIGLDAAKIGTEYYVDITPAPEVKPA